MLPASSHMLTSLLLHLVIAPNGFLIDSVLSLTQENDGWSTLNFTGMCQQYGRKAEEHTITTDDGYMLTVFRLPTLKNNSRVIFLQHGLTSSADIWALFGPKRSLGNSSAMLLSDEGYDVWLGNVRGNVYGRRHVTLTPEDPKFWDFSLDELGLRDLPAMLDYTLRVSGAKRVTFVGHSQGAAMITMLLSEKQEYDRKVDLAVMFAPSCYCKSRSPPRVLSILLRLMGQRISSDGLMELGPRSPASTEVWRQCRRNFFTMQICLAGLDASFGADRQHISEETWGELARYHPSGFSLKNVFHFLQHFEAGKMQHYDHEDKGKNFALYKQSKVPEYDVFRITTPVIIYQGGRDIVVTKDDADAFTSKFAPGVLRSNEIIPGYNHVSIMYADDFNPVVYGRLLMKLSEFHSAAEFSNSSVTFPEEI